MQIASEQMDTALRRINAIQQRVQKIETYFTLPPAEAAYQMPAGTPASGSALTPASYEPLISKASAQYHLRPSLLRAVMQVESGGNPDIVSPRGAQGLMQLLPSTAAGLGVNDPFNPEQNLMAGARYLRQHLDRYNGDERLALAAYNAGPGAVKRYGGVPPFPETQRYVNNVLSLAGSE